MGNVRAMPRGEPRPPACREARRVTALTAAYEALDSLIIELHRLRADNRRLNLELAAARTQRDSLQVSVRLSASRVAPCCGSGGAINCSEVESCRPEEGTGR